MADTNEMHEFQLCLSEEVIARAHDASNSAGVSLNDFINQAIAEKIASLEAQGAEQNLSVSSR